MKITVTPEDILANPTCPVEPALKRATGHNWLIGVGCAERQIEIDEDGDTVAKTEIIEMPDVAYNYIANAAAGNLAVPITFEVGEPIILP